MNSFVPQGLYAQSSVKIARLIKSMKFNCVRLNWSLELFYRNPQIQPEAIAGMRREGQLPDPYTRALDVLDQVVQDLATEKIMVILDNHMSNAGWYVHVLLLLWARTILTCCFDSCSIGSVDDCDCDCDCDGFVMMTAL